MKINFFVLFIGVLVLTSFLWAGCKSEEDFDGLKVVAKYKPLNLYV
jgi:hypothetical protein